VKRLLLVLLALAGPALSEVVPRPGAGDPRIQTVDYDADQVIRLAVAPGYVVTIEFAPDERIENVAIGDSAAWQVSANKRADHLFVKQAGAAADTNLIVLTDARHYAFVLTGGGSDGLAPITLRFTYPGLTTAPEVAVPVVSGAYRLGGSKLLRPAEIFDNGQATSIRWPKERDLPAIYAIDGSGRQSIVNGAMRGGYFVVDTVAPKLVFRSGRLTAYAVRQEPRRAR
jgi:type IV secretion system protein VirB9